MKDEDLIRIHHMLDAANEAMLFAKRKERRSLDADRMLALSIVKLIEIIGEAASGVSSEFRQRHADIPWQDIVSMRNRLVQAYFDIDLDRVWDTIADDLPRLASDLQRILKEA
jgi:uncharacterized protein with HEPN domain